MGDLLLHCTVVWINPPASLVKSKKHPDLAAFGKGLKSFFFFHFHKFHPSTQRNKNILHNNSETESILCAFIEL